MAKNWTSSNALWGMMSPYERAAAMALMEADRANPQDALNVLGAMVNRAKRSNEDLGEHVSKKIYQPTIEPAQQERLAKILKNPNFATLTSWAQRRWAGEESDPVQGATHFLAPESTMVALTRQNPQKYRSWPQWTGYDPKTGEYKGVIMRDRSHAFLAPEGSYSASGTAPTSVELLAQPYARTEEQKQLDAVLEQISPSAQTRTPDQIQLDELVKTVSPQPMVEMPELTPYQPPKARIPYQDGGAVLPEVVIGGHQEELPSIADLNKEAQTAQLPSIGELNEAAPPKPEISQAGAFGSSLVDALTLNFADEIEGLWGAGALGYLSGDPEAVRKYEQTVKESRARAEEVRKQYPKTAFIGELVGSLPYAFVPFGGAARGATLGKQVASGAKAGAAFGAVSGAGAGEDAESRALGAAAGTVAGGTLGAAAPMIPQTLSFAYDRTLRPAFRVMHGWKNPEHVTASRVAAAVLADQDDIVAGKARGMTMDDWQRAKAAGEPVTLADLGAGRTQALLRSAANTSPEGRATIEKAVQERFRTQPERIASDIRHLVSGGANAVRTQDQLKAAYDKARILAYRAAFADPKAQQLWDGELAQISQAPAVQEAIRGAFVTAKDEAAKLGLSIPKNPFSINPQTNRIEIAKGITPNLQFWDVVKKNLDNIGTKESEYWSKILRNKLDNQVPIYKDARSVAADYFGARDAVEAGQMLAKKSMDPEELSKFLKSLDPSELELVREGFASDLATKFIEEKKFNVDISDALLNTIGDRKRFEMVFGPQGVKKVEARLFLESIMDNARKALGNSTTARQLIEAGLAGGATARALSNFDLNQMATGAALGAGARKALAMEMAQGIRTLAGYVDRGVAKRVAELLVSDDFNKVQEGIRLATKNQKIMDGLRDIANVTSFAAMRAAQTGPEPQERAQGGRVERPFELAPRPSDYGGLPLFSEGGSVTEKMRRAQNTRKN